MRHVQITRLAWGVTMTFGAAALAFAATRPAVAPVQRQPVQAGETHFATRCAACHSPAAFGRWAELHPDPEERIVWLSRLLEHHYPPPEEERPFIIKYIEAQITGTDGT